MTPHRPLHEDLALAADELEKTALAIKESNAVGDRQWVAPPEYAELMANDRAEHDEQLRLAGVLRRHAAAYARVEKDAERYRWLRDKPTWISLQWNTGLPLPSAMKEFSGDGSKLDSAIDAVLTDKREE